MDPDSEPAALTVLCNQSFAWPPRALVGVDMDQKITSRVPRHVRRVFLHRTLPLHIRIRTGRVLSSECLCFWTNRLSLLHAITVTSYFDINHRVHRIHFIRPGSCISMVRIRTLDLPPSGRPEMAQ
jgi:hypothetical protein